MSDFYSGSHPRLKFSCCIMADNGTRKGQCPQYTCDLMSQHIQFTLGVSQLHPVLYMATSRSKKRKQDDSPDKSVEVLSKALDLCGKCNKNAQQRVSPYSMICVACGLMLVVKTCLKISIKL